jgi:putative transposase
MALDHAALLDLLDTLKAGDAGERIRVAAETMYQALIDTELTATIGAQPWERTETRTAQRNGSRACPGGKHVNQANDRGLGHAVVIHST